MGVLARYIEELRLGVLYDPHTDSRHVLTELITVCPECHSVNSLSHNGEGIACSACGWATHLREPAQAA
jgi:hypothetical protein